MIPLVLMAGFLGAGKTRFLTELAPRLAASGIRVRIILNDFQNARVDAARLGALEALVTPLNGECVCCGSLRELLQTLYEVPADANSVMIIEANGATETDELLGHLTTDRKLAHFTLPVQLTVVDAARWQKRWWHNGLERAQVSTATHILLNWTHKLTAEKLQSVSAAVRAENARAMFVDTDGFATWLRSLLADVTNDPARGGRGSGVAAQPRPRDLRAPHTHPFGSLALPLPLQVSRPAFEHFVRQLPPSVVRAKGLVRFVETPGPMYVWHRVPGRAAARFDESWPHADALPTALFIGVDLPLAELTAAIDALALC